MIHRNEYIDWLRQWQDKPVIKVIIGVRRCGKSTLLTLFKNDLIKRGILPEQIISLNLEDLKFDYIKTYLDLNQEVEKKLCTDKMNYIEVYQVIKKRLINILLVYWIVISFMKHNDLVSKVDRYFLL